MARKSKGYVSQKISKIMHEGVRRSTRKPVSASNPRRKVSQKQAVAIAYSMARKKGYRVARRKSARRRRR